MLTSIAWLNDYLDRPVDADEADRLLTDLGFPIDFRREAESGDTALEVEITSNRGDCLSHVGQARDIAATSGRSLKYPDTDLPNVSDESATSLVTVENNEPELCPVYTARIIRGVKVGPSPDWLVERLHAIGQDSINNVADITNYVLMELGQPLHAFDLNKLAGPKIVVRMAKPGEKIDALNAESYELRPDSLVIADADVPVAIAGVMGGEHSKVTEDTTDVLLEAAGFDIESVRNTVRALKVEVKNKPGTESSYRFERGIDPCAVEVASKRAARLIVELCGGTICEGGVRVGADEPEPKHVAMRVARCNALLGIDVPVEAMVGYFNRLGLQPKLNADQTAIDCTIPTFRLDLSREADLIEEIARMHGLEHLPVSDKIHIVARPVQQDVAARRLVRQVLVAHGFHEAMTMSFLTPKRAKRFVPAGHDFVELQQGIRKRETALRPIILPNLLASRKLNQDVGNHDVCLFETAHTWSRKDGQIVESQRLTLLADVGNDPATTLRALRGAIAELVETLTAEGRLTVEPVDVPNLTAAGRLLLNDQPIGTLGLVDDVTRDLFELQTGVATADLDLPTLIGDYPPDRQVGALPRFPGIERDLSIVVDDDVRWSTIEQTVRAVDPEMMEQLDFLTTYRGKPIPAGRKSVSFRMTFRDPEKTLRHDQVDPQVAAVVERLRRDVNAELRT